MLFCYLSPLDMLGSLTCMIMMSLDESTKLYTMFVNLECVLPMTPYIDS
jgi:hypothetical protein